MVWEKILERVHINRNARIAKRFFRRTRQFFAVILYVLQEKLTKLCEKTTARRAVSVNVNTLQRGKIMNGNDLLNIMSDVDDKLITAAEGKRKKRPPFALIAGAAVAAAAAVALSIGVSGVLKKRVPKTLPMLEVSIVNHGAGGAGGAGADEESIRWSGTQFETLPVYRSTTTDPDREKMVELLENAAKTLGVDPSELKISDETISPERESEFREMMSGSGAPDEEIERMIRNMKMYSRISGSTDKIGIYVDSMYTVSVYWRDGFGMELPEEHKLPDIAQREDFYKAGEYILEQYPQLFGLNNPILVEAPFSCAEFYEGGTEAEVLLNRDRKKANVIFSKVGDEYKVTSLYIMGMQDAEKLGDYPIIGVEEARELLFDGGYLTHEDYKLNGSEEITAVDMEYISSFGIEYLLPYYRFVVKLSGAALEKYENDTGMVPGAFGDEVYFSCYVPAVESRYISNMPNAAE